jgi:hypothetical protein
MHKYFLRRGFEYTRLSKYESKRNYKKSYE